MSSASTMPVSGGSAPHSMDLESSVEHTTHAIAAAASSFPGSNTSYSEAIDKQVHEAGDTMARVRARWIAALRV